MKSTCNFQILLYAAKGADGGNIAIQGSARIPARKQGGIEIIKKGVWTVRLRGEN